MISRDHFKIKSVCILLYAYSSSRHFQIGCNPLASMNKVTLIDFKYYVHFIEIKPVLKSSVNFFISYNIQISFENFVLSTLMHQQVSFQHFIVLSKAANLKLKKLASVKNRT